MDVIDLIQIPSFERRRDRYRRWAAAIGAALLLGTALERYNSALSLSLKALGRRLIAALNAWLEESSGTKLFTLEGDEPPPLTYSALELSALNQPGLPFAKALGGRGGIHGSSASSLRSNSRGRGQPGAQRPSLEGADAHPVVVRAAGAGEEQGGGATTGPQHGGPPVFPESAAATPQWFQSTKFFAVLDVDEAKELFEQTTKIYLAPREPLFYAGEPSDSGIFIVTNGSLGVFLDDEKGGPPVHANTLRDGESVGDLDVVDGALRSVTCIALDQGCHLVQVPRALFLQFVGSHPRALLLYLQQALARLWRVAHFMLSDYLSMPLYKPKNAPSSCPNCGTVLLSPGQGPGRTSSSTSGVTAAGRAPSLTGQAALTIAAAAGSAPDALALSKQTSTAGSLATTGRLSAGGDSGGGGSTGSRGIEPESPLVAGSNTWKQGGLSRALAANGALNSLPGSGLGAISEQPAEATIVDGEGDATHDSTSGATAAEGSQEGTAPQEQDPSAPTSTSKRPERGSSMPSAFEAADVQKALGKGDASASKQGAKQQGKQVTPAAGDGERSKALPRGEGDTGSGTGSSDDADILVPGDSGALIDEGDSLTFSASAPQPKEGGSKSAKRTASGGGAGSGSVPVSGNHDATGQQSGSAQLVLPEETAPAAVGAENSQGSHRLSLAGSTSLRHTLATGSLASSLPSAGASDLGEGMRRLSSSLLPPSPGFKEWGGAQQASELLSLLEASSSVSGPNGQPGPAAAATLQGLARSFSRRHGPGGSRPVSTSGSSLTAAGPVAAALALLDPSQPQVPHSPRKFQPSATMIDPNIPHDVPMPKTQPQRARDTGFAGFPSVGNNLASQEQQTPSTSFYKSKRGRDHDSSSSSSLKGMKDALQQPQLLGRGSIPQPTQDNVASQQQANNAGQGAQGAGSQLTLATGVSGSGQVQADQQDVPINQSTTGKPARELGGENRSVTADLTAAAARLSALSRQQQEQEKQAAASQQMAAAAVAAAVGGPAAFGSTGSVGSAGARGARVSPAGRPGSAVQPPQVAGPYCSIQRSPTLRKAFELGSRACLADGWDVVDVEELELSPAVWAQLADPRQSLGAPFPLPKGGVLQELDWGVGQFYVVLDGHLMAERSAPSTTPGGSGPSTGAGAAGARPPAQPQPGYGGPLKETAIVRPGSLISCAAFLSSTPARCRIVALEKARLVLFGWQHLEAMCADMMSPPSVPSSHLGSRTPSFSSNIPVGSSKRASAAAVAAAASAAYAAASRQAAAQEVLLPLLLAAARAMGPVIRRFISLGLNRVWLESGGFAYQQGEDASCLYVVISGRLRLQHESAHPITGKKSRNVEEEVARGEAVGAVWAIAGGAHDTTAVCVRDSELVRMSRQSFELIARDNPTALTKLFSNMARRLSSAWEARLRRNKVTSGTLAWVGSNTTGPGAAAAAATASTGPLQQLQASQGPRGTPAGSSGSSSIASISAQQAGQGVAGLTGLTSAPTITTNTHSDIVTIAIIPAGVMPGQQAPPTPSRPGMAPSLHQPPGVASLLALKRVSGVLKEALQQAGEFTIPGSSGHGGTVTGGSAAHGGSGATGTSSVLCLNSTTVGLLFPTAFERLDVRFYRSKITSWLSSQEEEYRYIILEGDYHPTPWSSVCVAQADVILVVAAEGAQPALGECEAQLVFGPGGATGKARAATQAVAAAVGSGSSSSSGVPAQQPPASSSSQQQHQGAVASASAPANASQPPDNASSIGVMQEGGLMQGSTAGLSKPGEPTSISPLVAAANAAAAQDAAAAAAAQATATWGQQLIPGSGRMQAPGATSGSGSGVTAGPSAGAQQVPQGTVDTHAAGGSSHLPTETARASGGVGATHPPAAAAAAGSQRQNTLEEEDQVTRRVELVILHHDHGPLPQGTAAWLAARPTLTRYHHIRLSRPSDVGRLARWICGRAVGLVLSGGGSRGLAHLGVLMALEDCGVPVDLVGGTSQGAFMAGLYAQDLGREDMHGVVRDFARQMGSISTLVRDATLPLLSYFSGAAFEEALQRSFSQGPANVEDLWIPTFCVSTNLSKGEPAVHVKGLLWKVVRASMTLVGLLPPVLDESGDLLVDGGYVNNMPVDVARQLGVESVIVVDVEDKETGWRGLAPYGGGVSGWKLLWDRWCPIPSWRTQSQRIPTYGQMVNQLTWMAHAHNVKRMVEDYRIDVYLRPHNIGHFKLLDYHLMDRIAKDAYKYTTHMLSQCSAMPRISTLAQFQAPARASSSTAGTPPIVATSLLGPSAGASSAAVSATSGWGGSGGLSSSSATYAGIGMSTAVPLYSSDYSMPVAYSTPGMSTGGVHAGFGSGGLVGSALAPGVASGGGIGSGGLVPGGIQYTGSGPAGAGVLPTGGVAGMTATMPALHTGRRDTVIGPASAGAFPSRLPPSPKGMPTATAGLMMGLQGAPPGQQPAAPLSASAATAPPPTAAQIAAAAQDARSSLSGSHSVPSGTLRKQSSSYDWPAY